MKMRQSKSISYHTTKFRMFNILNLQEMIVMSLIKVMNDALICELVNYI